MKENVKAELMHALANTALPGHVHGPLREVVLRRITERQPRLLRYATQLAASLWDEELEAEVTRLEAEGSPEQRRASAQLHAGARNRMRSLTAGGGPTAE